MILAKSQNEYIFVKTYSRIPSTISDTLLRGIRLAKIQILPYSIQSVKGIK